MRCALKRKRKFVYWVFCGGVFFSLSHSLVHCATFPSVAIWLECLVSCFRHLLMVTLLYFVEYPIKIHGC